MRTRRTRSTTRLTPRSRMAAMSPRLQPMPMPSTCQPRTYRPPRPRVVPVVSGSQFYPVGFLEALAVGVVEANNNINDDVKAFISDANTRVTSAGGVEVQANSTPTIQCPGRRGLGQHHNPSQPREPFGVRGQRRRHASTNTIGGKVYADIDSGSTVQANGGAVLVSATNTASINATLARGPCPSACSVCPSASRCPQTR